jgi:DNA-binding transcriptional MerR regulator
MQQSGVARQTIHYYVRIGLLPKPHRTSRTYALYSRETVDLLKAIKECQDVLRLSLDEIGNMLRKAQFDVRRVRSELDDLRDNSAPHIRSAESRPQFVSIDQLLTALQPKPPEGWIEELYRFELIRVRGPRLCAETVSLIRSIWKLCQLGFKLDDLRPIVEEIRREANTELHQVQGGPQFKAPVRADYSTALRMLDAFDQFAHWARKESLRTSFDQQTYRSTNLFVGPNRKHVLPSETFLSEMGLNREIDRLIGGLDRSPQNRKALSDLARAYNLRSDWFSLAGVSQQILQLDPLNVRATADLSRSLFYLGDIDQSVQLLERRLRAGSDPLLKFRLGQALLLQAKDAGLAELLSAVRRKQQLGTEALHEAREMPSIRRWILLDRALDDLTVSDPLQLNQPTIEDLEKLCREYESISDRGRSVLSRINLAMGRILAMYALYLVYRKHQHPKTEDLLGKIILMDPHSALTHRPMQLGPDV